MKKIIQRVGFSLTLASMFACPLLAQPGDDPTPVPLDTPSISDPSPRLRTLASVIPPAGQLSTMKALGMRVITVTNPPGPASQSSPSYTFAMPADLDRRSTDGAPYKGKYPGIHLNLPLKVQPSAINYLFISDQPELIKDSRLRDPAPGGADVGPGSTGVYARASIPPRSTTRVLIDHSNETSRPLNFWLVWIPQDDGFLSVHKRSESIRVDSVAAGSNAFQDAAQVAVEPRQALVANQGITLVSSVLNPHDTVVVQLEYFASCGGQLATVIGEDLDAPPLALDTLNQQPVLHSVIWREEQERLGKFIDPKSDPTRFSRILNTAQHSRGQFQFPDRIADGDYAVKSWDEAAAPVQVYSLFESIPGVDPTVKNGDKASDTDNRGKYGARIGMRFHLRALPPGCQEVALLAMNRSPGFFGGRHWVSDGRKTVCETLMQPKGNPGLLRQNQVATVWRGPAHAGDTLTMWTEPVANTSVSLWYLIVPIPGPDPVTGQTPTP